MNQKRPQSPLESPTRLPSRRTVGKGIAWTVPAIAVGAPAPAFSVSPPPPGLHEITMLGWANATQSGQSEFRADLTVDVATGDSPTRMRFTYTPGVSDWYDLVRLEDVQQSVDQAYGIVARVPLGNGMDRLYIHARGDAGEVAPAVPTTYQVLVEATWADGSTTTRSIPVWVNARNDTGRPVGVNAWDFTTAGLPGYVGPNSQTGWGTVVPASSSAGVPGAKFHVDASNSGRSAVAGNDVTTSVFYQFVDSSGAPAGPTPVPVQLTIPNHPPGVQGDILSEIGTVSFGAPGYYKLLVWPQSSNSTGSPTPPSTGVAWDPATDPGHQVGSVFWHIV